MKHNRINIKRIVVIAMFCALAYVTMFVLRIKVSFLTFDAKDAVITIAAMLFGPGVGVLISLIVSTLELITVSGTGLHGWVMNFISSSVFAVLASSIYQRKRKMSSAVIGLASSVVGMTAVMMVMNLIVTPLYTGMEVGDVAAMIPTLLLPFNLTKATLNAALVMVLYKPISLAMKRAHVTGTLEGDGAQYRMQGRSLAFMLGGLALVVICVLIMLLVLDGSFSLVRGK